jgi:leader peptidase (prepilin peptidase)/N-methyltransferase
MGAVSDVFTESSLFWAVFLAVTGLFFGSFLNVLIDRLPEGKSIVKPGSHCQACGRSLTIADLVPVFSYIFLKGRCRSCGVKLPLRLPIVELATGALFGLLFWHFGFSIELAVSLFYGCLFLVIMVIDLERGLILNSLTYPAMVIAVILSLVASDSEIVPSIGSAAGAGALGFGLFLLIIFSYYKIRGREGMGPGDVKMAALMGLAVGFPAIIVAILVAAIVGALIVVPLVLANKLNMEQPLGFGIFLAPAAMVALLWGNTIFDWYVGLF